VQREPENAPPPLTWSAMAYDAARAQTILFGGMLAGETMSDETWAWDGDDWTPLDPADSPSARFVHGMAYDSVRERVVLFGGITTSLGKAGLTDTWEWDGTNWSLIETETSPPGRGVHGGMSFDEGRGVTVISGGGTQPWVATIADVWEYDGTNWSDETPETLPEARVAPCFTYDATRQVSVLFGGGNWNPYYDDTWTWDGTTFQELEPETSPSARQSHRCAWDGWRERVLVWNGDNGGSISDSWEWDGTNWANAGEAPPAACCFGLAFDIANREAVIFTPAGETWTYGVP
jgi:hypothetical protein